MGKKRIVIVGGHTTPALALIEEIRETSPEWEIYYFGTKYAHEGTKALSFEYKTLEKLKFIKFIPFSSGKFYRHFSLKALTSLLKIPLGFCQSLYLLLKIKPKIIVSFGGFLSMPVVVTSWFLGIPCVTHEQTKTLGLANRINLRFVKVIAVSFPESLKDLPKEKSVFTGNLLRKQIFAKEFPEESQIFKFLKGNKLPIIYITGGKSGSEAVNRVVFKARDQLRKKFSLVHQIGVDRNLEEMRIKNYFALRFVKDLDLGPLLNKTRVVISRAGANIIYELLALNKPAVLIPLPFTSGDEQRKNAEFLRKNKLAAVIEQKELTPEVLLRIIFEIVNNDKKYCLEKENNWRKFDFKTTAKKFWQIVLETLEK